MQILLNLFQDIKGLSITMVIWLYSYVPVFFFNPDPSVDIIFQRAMWTVAIITGVFTCISCYYNIKYKKQKEK